MKNRPRSFTLAAGLAGLFACTGALAQITVYEHDNYQGRSFTTPGAVVDLRQRGFNDRASSAVVGGNQAWEICENSAYGGNCRMLRPGQYATLSAMGMNDRVSSVRAVGRNAQPEPWRYAPQPVVSGDYRRRRGERTYEAPVRSARAVYGPPEQRCWMEREQVSEGRGDARVPGAIIGAVIGGILGHQVGGGTGRDIATVGGVVAGAAVGANVGRRQEGPGSSREVQRCDNGARPATPAYWDVSYEFRGALHQVQLTSAPGPSVTVNRKGEPRA
jgi:uncharacterized protein YcfJ